MEIRSSVKALNYARKLLLHDTDNILPFPIRPQKPAFAGKQPVRLPRCTPQEAGISPAALDTLYRALSDTEPGSPHGCVVVRGGRVISEGWWAPYTPNYWHVTHSMCKTFTGTAIGLLVDEQRLSLDEHLCDIFPEHCSLRTSRRTRALTVRHLLTMSSGVSFKESGAVLEKDWAKCFFEADVLFDPGTEFDYNSMNSYMLSAIVKKKTGSGLVDYLTPRLFEPLGFGDVAWETCPQGIEKGGWGLYVFLEDAVKLGMVYRDGGVWHAPDGTQTRILSEEWVSQAITPHFRRETGEEYGYQLWPHSADGTFMFNGMFGQYVFVAPALNLVIGLNAGAANLFTRSSSLHALQAFLQECTAPCSPTAVQALAYTQAHLRFNRTVPPMPPTVQNTPTLGQRLRALVPKKPKPSALESTQAAPLDAQSAALNGAHYVFEKNRVGMFPMILSCMEDWYTDGVSELSFFVRDNTLWMNWTENKQVFPIPIGFSDAGVCNMTLGGNCYALATMAEWTKNEDDIPVLKLAVHFLEHSSTRLIKIFFYPNRSIMLAMDESPNLMLAMRMIENSSSSALASRLELFRDMDYLWYRIDELCAPHVRAAPPELAQQLLTRSLQA